MTHAFRRALALPPHVLRIVACLGLAVLIGACAPLNQARLALAGEGRAATEVPDLDMPYGQMTLRIDRGRPGRLLLVQESDGVQTWLAANGTTLWMRGGRVLATRGLRQDIAVTHPLNASAAVGVETLYGEGGFAQAPQFYTELDGKTGPVAVHWRSSLSAQGGPQAVVLEDEVISLQRVTEQARVAGGGLHWSNEYWIHTQTGEVIRSTQQVPGSDVVLQLEFKLQRRDEVQRR